ncbi:MAG: hypothetical protein OXI63_17695 [Candidatus Poribacteria bacterium]|nr:hypothetical protein [Candidatus Poribacteria bacterium]
MHSLFRNKEDTALISNNTLTLHMYWAEGVGVVDHKHANLDGTDIETLILEEAFMRALLWM